MARGTKNMAFQKVEDWRISSRPHPNVATSKHGDSTGCPVFCFGRFAAGHLLERCRFFCEHDGLESEIGSTRSCENWCEHVTTKCKHTGRMYLYIRYTYHFHIWVDLLHPAVLSRTGISSQSISPLWRQEFALSYRDDSFIAFVQRHRYPVCFANHKCQSNV